VLGRDHIAVAAMLSVVASAEVGRWTALCNGHPRISSIEIVACGVTAALAFQLPPPLELRSTFRYCRARSFGKIYERFKGKRGTEVDLMCRLQGH